ncbi:MULTISPECIES: phage tail protein [unclassified Providencia]|uniref:phage tail protein n=1 Tax=unclassified Providencia TaxID=2633465 RepID=UPI00234BEAA0|nr:MULTISPECIES: phage tail protein [unclassified Providencia]
MKYFALLTKLGENLLAQATALGTKLELTHMAVGDGGGSLPTPDTNQTKLIAEKRRAAINTLFIDDKNKNQIIAEQIIPEQDGGWWIREIGLFDKAGNLIAVANCPETYKPQLAEGSGRTQSIRMVLIVSHTESVTLKVDPSVVLATRQYVDEKVVQETGTSKITVMSQDAATRYFAASKNFYKTPNYVGMRPDTPNYVALIYDDGRFTVWDEENKKFAWAFNGKGEMTTGLIPVTSGGTGAKDAVLARANLSVPSIAEFNYSVSLKIDKASISQQLGNTRDQVPSLDLLSKELGKKQGIGNYAPGDLFFKATNYVGMQTEKKNYAVLLYEDGRVALWDEGNRKIQWEFDKNGHLTKGLIPISGGGTGATDAASARKNLSVYSIQEVNTELDKKASGSCFYDNATHTGMRTRSKLYAVAMSETGTFGAWDDKTQRYVFSFDKTGQLTNGVIPVARIAGLSEIGVNQSWVDVTKQRALNTAYTNSTSKPIFVSATCKLQTKLTSIELWIGGVKASTYYKDSNSDSAVCAIVPAGANYTIRATDGDILTWAELR